MAEEFFCADSDELRKWLVNAKTPVTRKKRITKIALDAQENTRSK